jgi:hypothetical protein
MPAYSHLWDEERDQIRRYEAETGGSACFEGTGETFGEVEEQRSRPARPRPRPG